MAAGLEDCRVTDRCRQRRRCGRADAGNRHQPLTHLVFPRLFGQPRVEVLDPLFGVAQLVDEALENASRQTGNPGILQVGHHGGQLRDLAGALGCDNAELGEVSTQRVDQLSLLGDQRLAHPVDRQGALLLLALDRDKPHARSLHRFADRFGIGPVILLALDVGFDILRRHQPHRVAEPSKFPCPKVRPGTGLHPNHTRRKIDEERQHRVPPQPLRHNHLALAINAMNLKHRLRQIETDERRRHRTISLMKNVLSAMWPYRAGSGGNVHFINVI